MSSSLSQPTYLLQPTLSSNEARQRALLPIAGTMARSVRLFLIRHGETVDNVAGLYAGVRDSELTNHGYQQATRLGAHFKATGVSFTHIFSSHLQRAKKTAGKIRESQPVLAHGGTAAGVPEVQQVPLLVEQDFGSMEGKKFYERSPESKMTGKEHHRQENTGATPFVDVESKDSMARRADSFLDTHFLPLLDDSTPAEKCIAIVSHGIFLSTLWKRILLRLPKKSVVLSSELQATTPLPLEHLGGWSNTGYLELSMVSMMHMDSLSKFTVIPAPIPESSLSPTETPTTEKALGKIEVPQSSDDTEVARSGVVGTRIIAHENVMDIRPRLAHGWKTTIITINGKDHLKGLKRTGGGVGSSRHDTSQKSLEMFFKRRKVE